MTVFFLSLFFLAFRLFNLTGLPIFNDESIYLDWGWRETHLPKILYLSLFDSKPPLLMWIFGLSQNIFSDPLLAGRLVMIVFGLITALGIYFIAQGFFSQKAAVISFLIYTLSPIFAFFDRQALMESAISAIGVWSVYLIIKVIEKKSLRLALLLGIILGTGIFIKTNGLFFLIAIFLLVIVCFYKKRLPECKYYLLSIVVSQLFLLPLYLQPQFWQTLANNSRYSLTVNEILSFPVKHWANNVFNTGEIIIWYFGPIYAVFFIVSIGLFLKKISSVKKIILFWFFFNLGLTILTARNIAPRYLVSFLPLSVLMISIIIADIFKGKLWNFLWFTVIAIYPLLITVKLLTNPLAYFNLLSRQTKFSQKYDYVEGWPSGYGIPETVNYLKRKAGNQVIVVGVRGDHGNPESAIFAYFNNSKNIRPIFFEAKNIPNIESVNCIKTNLPVFFVSRDNNLGGFDKFLIKEDLFPKPAGKSYVGIYRINNNCIGKSININFQP